MRIVSNRDLRMHLSIAKYIVITQPYPFLLLFVVGFQKFQFAMRQVQSIYPM